MNLCFPYHFFLSFLPIIFLNQNQELAADRRKWESIRRSQIERAADQVRMFVLFLISYIISYIVSYIVSCISYIIIYITSYIISYTISHHVKLALTSIRPLTWSSRFSGAQRRSSFSKRNHTLTPTHVHRNRHTHTYTDNTRSIISLESWTLIFISFHVSFILLYLFLFYFISFHLFYRLISYLWLFSTLFDSFHSCFPPFLTLSGRVLRRFGTIERRIRNDSQLFRKTSRIDDVVISFDNLPFINYINCFSTFII